jgi:type IV pilus assembly protein PilO
MNLSEVNWDPNAAGSWPLPIKIVAVLLACALVIGADIYFITLDQLSELDALEANEEQLKTSFETKQKKASSLQDYKDQLKQIESSLSDMIKQMPTRAEVASLLVDISQTGLASGLEFKLFQPGGEIRKDFYSELPINIQVVGKYEELGLFVSGLASLPRIVTVHDVNISPLAAIKDGEVKLNMTAIVKTYNEGGEEASADEAKKKRGR